MNQVYLSGVVAEPPIRIGAQEETSHTVFHLCVSHKTSKGEWHRELYSVNSWNAAAQWVLQNLRQGQRVALVGYLTQRTFRTGDGVFVSVEVTSQEFLPMEIKRRENMAPSAPAWLSDSEPQVHVGEDQTEPAVC